VQEVRHRLLFEQLEQWVEKLGSEEPVDRAVLKELVVQLLATVVMLPRQHRVNK